MTGGRGPARSASIGLEVHVQLRTRTKVFCGCPAVYGAPPNTLVCPVCLGLPGALPVPNRRAVALAVRTALALGCEVRRRSGFDRKHYFYPDLPKGYQITQHADPLAVGGTIVPAAGSGAGPVRVRRVHLEEDAGKSSHDRYPGTTAIDLNRAGVPLVEIVTEPDLASPAAARACLVRVKQILRDYAAVSDCRMEEGSLRVDANLSLPRPGERRRGARVEIKNLNSFAHVERALERERERQLRTLAEGKRVRPETRLYDPGRDATRPLRGKEERPDYRYLPEPDLPPLELPSGMLEAERRAAGEPPHEVEARLADVHGLPEEDAARIAATPGRARYFEAAAAGRDRAFARTACHFILGELAAEANRRGSEVGEAELLGPDRLRRVVELRREGRLSSHTAARALELLMRGEGAGEEVDALVEARGLDRVDDPERIGRWVEEVLAAHPEEAARCAAGEAPLLEFLMGRLMRLSGGRADPERARGQLRERLGR